MNTNSRLGNRKCKWCQNPYAPRVQQQLYCKDECRESMNKWLKAYRKHLKGMIALLKQRGTIPPDYWLRSQELEFLLSARLDKVPMTYLSFEQKD